MRNRMFTLSVSLIVITMVMCTGCSILVKDPLEKASTIYREDPKEAIKLYNEVLEKDSYSLEAYAGLFRVLEREEAYEDLADRMIDLLESIDDMYDEEDVLNLVDKYCGDLVFDEMKIPDILALTELLQHVMESYDLGAEEYEDIAMVIEMYGEQEAVAATAEETNTHDSIVESSIVEEKEDVTAEEEDETEKEAEKEVELPVVEEPEYPRTYLGAIYSDDYSVDLAIHMVIEVVLEGLPYGYYYYDHIGTKIPFYSFYDQTLGIFELYETVDEEVTGLFQLPEIENDILSGYWYTPDYSKKFNVYLELEE